MQLQPQTLATEADLVAFASALGKNALPGDVFALVGDLGAGKTHFAKGLAAALDIDPNSVTSPTFTLVHEYSGGSLPLFHFDFYRLASETEVLDLGWDEYLDSDAVLAVEWADKFPSILPPHTTWLHFAILPGGGRRITPKTLT